MPAIFGPPAGHPSRMRRHRRQMRRPALSTAVIAAVVALYAAASLWPYDWQARGWSFINGAEPLPDGVARFRQPGVAVVRGSPDWVEAAMRFHQLELFLSARALDPQQSGPARILTLSLTPYESNLTVGQDGADLILRLRTPWTSANGRIDGEPVARVPGVFLTDDWIDTGILVEPGRLHITVEGVSVLDAALPPRPLETWDPSHRLAFGNEPTGNRPWLGEIRRALVRAGERTEEYAGSSELRFPPIGIFGHRQGTPKLVPLRTLNPRDAVDNVLLYVPLGLLLGLLLADRRDGQRWRLALGVVVVVAGVSAGMEVLQVLVPRRAPSVDDLIFNTLGGGLGAVVALWVQSQRRAPPRS